MAVVELRIAQRPVFVTEQMAAPVVDLLLVREHSPVGLVIRLLYLLLKVITAQIALHLILVQVAVVGQAQLDLKLLLILRQQMVVMGVTAQHLQFPARL